MVKTHKLPSAAQRTARARNWQWLQVLGAAANLGHFTESLGRPEDDTDLRIAREALIRIRDRHRQRARYSPAAARLFLADVSYLGTPAAADYYCTGLNDALHLGEFAWVNEVLTRCLDAKYNLSVEVLMAGLMVTVGAASELPAGAKVGQFLLDCTVDDPNGPEVWNKIQTVVNRWSERSAPDPDVRTE